MSKCFFNLKIFRSNATIFLDFWITKLGRKIVKRVYWRPKTSLLHYVLMVELSLCHKSQFFNTYISKTRWRKPLIFQTLIFWSIGIHSLKYLRSTTLGCRDEGIKKSELFVIMTQNIYDFFNILFLICFIVYNLCHC